MSEEINVTSQEVTEENVGSHSVHRTEERNKN